MCTKIIITLPAQRCSLCGKDRSEVKAMLSNDVGRFYFCSECVDLGSRLLIDEDPEFWWKQATEVVLKEFLEMPLSQATLGLPRGAKFADLIARLVELRAAGVRQRLEERISGLRREIERRIREEHGILVKPLENEIARLQAMINRLPE